MNKFLFKSSDADLLKILSILDTIQKNGLYCTYRIDSLLKNFDKLLNDKSLQKQVDEYFSDDSENIPDSEKVTNHEIDE